MTRQTAQHTPGTPPRTNDRADETDARTGFELTEPFHRITDVIKCKWTLAIIHELDRGVSRPSELQRALPGLTSKVLTDRLKRLEDYDLIDRRAFAEVPPRVEYTLTSHGQDLKRVLDSVIQFIGRWTA